MEDTHIALAHGNGGRFMRELIDEIFARHLGNPELDVQADAVPLALNGSETMFTTDGFTVQPLEFPGGNIGSLAVHGIYRGRHGNRGTESHYQDAGRHRPCH
jgi:hydrogenase expression/formation protein HypE